jgi:hypothetical protein
MANNVRGEAEFAAGDRTFVLRPTFEALCAIEDRLDTGVIELAERIAQRRHGVRDIGAVLFEAAHAADPTVSQAEIEAAVARAGLRAATLAALNLLACALGGPDPEKKDDQPAAPAAP